ncbi:MAG: nuclear transport factor 2 family protein [Tsuneonella sp.]
MSEATEVLASLYRAFAAGDGDALGALLGDVEWVEARGGPYGGTYHGLAEVAEKVFGPIGRDVRDFSAVPDDILPVSDDGAIALGFYRGQTDAGPFEIRFGHLVRVAAGRVARFEQLTDTHEWREAVG